MNKIFCFGELLLRLSPLLNREWIQKASIPLYLGGAELNVATALATWNVPVKYSSALPDNYLSHEIIESLKARRIDTSAVFTSGNRMGTYYLPQGADLKSAGVIYDRAGSSFAELKPGMINWDEALHECSWFHFSAISPALNASTAAVCKEALEAASAKKIRISVDLNYRSKLWQYGKLPETVMSELVQYCHIIMGNIWAAESLLGIKAMVENSEDRSETELLNAAAKSILQLGSQYPAANIFAYTFRLQHKYWAVLKHGSETVVSKQFPIDDIIDKAGSGDCFMAGLLYGLYKSHTPQQVVNYAAAAAIGKLQEKGDSTNQTVEMINSKLL